MKLKSIFIAAALIPISVQAADIKQFVTANECLVAKAGLTQNVLGKNDHIALLALNEQELTKIMQAKAQKSKTPCGGFVDVTEEWLAFSAKPTTDKASATVFLKQLEKTSLKKADEYQIKYQNEVNGVLKEINPQNMWENLTTLTNFQNRNANTDLGVKAADWISKTVRGYADLYHRSNVMIKTIPTPRYKQPSVIVKIGDSDKPGVVVGGHMDTIVFFSQRQPGADDDGSGSVTIMEAIRSILKSGLEFKHPLYFIWYSAEEQGLIGSKAVVRNFQSEKIPVKSAIQFDMTGFAHKNDRTIWLLNDNVNENLTQYVAELTKTYVKQPVNMTSCGYGCSDHASWHQAGIPAAAPFEAKFGQENPHIHSTGDTMDHLSLAHMADYAKIAVAYAIEMAEPIKK